MMSCSSPDVEFDLNLTFRKHLNCSFDLNDLLELGWDNFDAEQMGQASCLERTEFEPSQLTNADQFVALMIVMGLTFNHDALLADALRIASATPLIVVEQFAASSHDSEPIDPRASGEPIASAEEFMYVLDSLQLERVALSPFVAACRHGRADLVQQWIPLVLANDYTRHLLGVGLTVACDADHVDCVEALLPHVAAETYHHPWFLFSSAVEHKAMRVAEQLLPRIATADVDGWADPTRALCAVVAHGDIVLVERLLDIIDQRAECVISHAQFVCRAVADDNAAMLRFLLARFPIPIEEVGNAFGVARRDGAFQILLEHLQAWRGDEKEFDRALALAVTATASLGSAERLKRVLAIQLREPGAQHLLAHAWPEVHALGDAASAAVLLDEPRVAVRWCEPLGAEFKRQHCRTLVTILEHPRMFGECEPQLHAMIFERHELPHRLSRIARMWLTDICMALRPLQLPSLVLDEIVRHLPTMSTMVSVDRLTKVIININERWRTAAKISTDAVNSQR
jgi:hypothetical protein